MDTTNVYITGVGCVTAAGRNADETWKTLMEGVSPIGPITHEEFVGVAGALGGVVPDEWLDEVPSLNRETRMAGTALRECLEMAGLDLARIPSLRVGLVVGKCQKDGTAPRQTKTRLQVTTDALGDHFGLDGPRVTISTACAAGNNAVGLGRDLILSGRADVVVAGGIDVLQLETWGGFAMLHSLDSQPCSPYGRSGGLNLGDGAAFVVLEAEGVRDAEARPVLAEVLGYGLSADAHHATAPDPTGRGAALAVRRAFRDAGVEAGDIDWVNGHGTGTKANDGAERNLMRGLFGERARVVPITSNKSFVGHTLGAAGAVEAVISVLAITQQTIPPTANSMPSDDFDFVVGGPRAARLRTVLSNNYAFGGANASLLLGAPGTTRPRERAATDVVVSGVGLVGAAGVGKAAWRDAVAGHGTLADPDDVLRSRPSAAPAVWRQMNRFTRLLMLAVRDCLDDAGLELDSREVREELGLVLTTSTGTAELSAALGEGAPSKPSELKQSVLNAPAGSVCQVLGLRGPTTTLVSGPAAAVEAVDVARSLIRNGQTDAVLVVTVEELAAVVAAENGQGVRPAPGAVALLVESAAHCAARGGHAYSRVLGVQSHTAPGLDQAAELAEGVRMLLAAGAVPLGALLSSGGAARITDSGAVTTVDDREAEERALRDGAGATRHELLGGLAVADALAGAANLALGALLIDDSGHDGTGVVCMAANADSTFSAALLGAVR